MIAGKGNPLSTLQSNSDPHKHHHHSHHHSPPHGHGDHHGGGLSTQESSLYSTHPQEQALPYEPSLQTSSSISVDMLPFPTGGGTKVHELFV